MNPIRYIRRAVAVLAALAAAALTFGAAPAFAVPEPLPQSEGPDGGATVPTLTHVVVVGGTPGWQIALIAAGAAALAALAAVLAYRTLTARRRAVTAVA